MRLSRRWFMILVVVGLLWWQWPAVAWFLDRAYRLVIIADAGRTEQKRWKLAKMSESMVKVVFLLESDRWLTFDLPPGQSVIRLLTNADLPEIGRARLPTPIPDAESWTYAIRTELLDARGNVLGERDYHFQTRLSEFTDRELQVDVTPSFYLGESILPADSRLMSVPLAGLGGAPARLKVQLLQADEPLTGVAIRVLYRNPISAHKLGYYWHRMMENQQRKLARGNVFGPDFMTAQEKENLLRNHWSPLAPRGWPGTDFQQRELYVLNEIEGDVVRDRPPPFGTLAEPGRIAVLPIPEEESPIRFVFTPLEDVAVSPQPPGKGLGGKIGTDLELRWYGRRLTDRETTRIPWTGKETVFERKWSGGTVEVRTPQALSVRAFRPGKTTEDRRRPAGSEEITPIPTFAWCYLLRGKSPVDFEILHAGQEATPLRVDVRRLSVSADRLHAGVPNSDGPPVVVAPLRVPYQFLDERGAVIHSGELRTDRPASEYDRARMLRQEFGVSEPSTFFFSAPPEAVRLRFPTADLDAVVAVYNRPALLENHTQVPEDYFHFNAGGARNRNWFLLRSPAHDKLEMVNRVPILAVQARPPEDDLEIAAGKFEWHGFLPGGNWRGRPLLIPRDPKAPFRMEASVATYLELAPDRDTELKMLGEAGRAEVARSLIYLRESDELFAVKFFVNGRLVHEISVDGLRGEILLPPQEQPKHPEKQLVRVTTSKPARIFLNYVDPGANPGLIKHTAFQLTVPLNFEYEKIDRAKRPKTEELLSLTLFRPIGAKERARIRVRIDRAEAPAIGPFGTWTFRDRIFDLRPAGGSPVPALGTRDLNLDAGQTFFFPVGADLPAGKFLVRVEPLDDPAPPGKGMGGEGAALDGYLLLSRSISGPYDKRDFFPEQPGRTFKFETK